jgi:hypothetical protein
MLSQVENEDHIARHSHAALALQEETAGRGSSSRTVLFSTSQLSLAGIWEKLPRGTEWARSEEMKYDTAGNSAVGDI